MKITTLLLLSACLSVSAGSFAQKVTLLQKNVKLEEIFKEIRKQTGYVFFYDTQVLERAKPVDIHVENVSVEDALQESLRGQSLDFSIERKTVTIFQKVDYSRYKEPVSMEHMDTELLVPLNIITGTVKDANGSPLAGVSVVVRGTNRGTISSSDGAFSIEANVGDVLEFTMVGYEKKESIIKDDAHLVIQLNPQTTQLGDVVITALGIKRDTRSLGYSVNEVSGEDMQKVPQENAINALTAKVPGLSITNTSQDINAVAQVVIRGRRSLTQNDAPLVVVNGNPIGNDPLILGNMDPNDIESVSVLKGPSAAALYGSRAGTGVLLITTKSGEGVIKGVGVSFNSGYNLNVPYQYLPIQKKFANGLNGEFIPGNNAQWFGPEEGTPEVLWNSDGQAVPLRFYGDAVQKFFRTGEVLTNNLSYQGSNSKGSFRLSVSTMGGSGIFPETELKKNSVDLAATYRISNKVKVSTNVHLSGSYSDNYWVPTNGLYQLESLYLVPLYIDINDFKDYWEIKNVQQRRWNNAYDNPWFVASEYADKFRQSTIYGNIKLDYHILDGLDLMTRIGSTYGYSSSTTLVPVSLNKVPDGTLSYSAGYSIQTNADFLLTYKLLKYKKDIQDFSVNLSGGGNLLFSNGFGFGGGGGKFTIPGIYNIQNVPTNYRSASNSLSRKRVNSLYGLANIGYKNFVYLDITGRNDWSSTLPVNNMSYFYPSASLSLIVSDMFKLPSFVSLFKIRGGWAQVGKDTGPYALDQYLASGYWANWGSVSSFELSRTLANPGLKPESATSKEGGVDLSFLQNRLGLNFTVYEISNGDQILPINVAAMSGYLYTNSNSGVVRSNGVEFGLHINPIKSRDLIWNANLSFSREHSKLVSLPPGIETISFWAATEVESYARVGQYLGDVWGNDAVRVKEGPYKGWPILDQNGYLQRDPDFIKIGNVNPDFSVGLQTDLTYKRFTLSASFDWRQGGQYYSTTYMRMVRGGMVDDWYKGAGSSTFTGILSNNSFGGDKGQLQDEIKAHPEKYSGRDGLVWVGGRNQELGGFPLVGSNIQNGAFFPGVRSDGNGGYIENFGGADTKYIPDYMIADPGLGWWSINPKAWMYDYSFIKLREFAIAYQFPEELVNSIKAQNLSLSLFVKNLILWTGAKNHMDPESTIQQQGGWALGYDRWNPMPWALSTGLRLSVQF